MTAMTLASERALEQAILQGTATNMDGDQQLSFELPVGFGSCLILEAYVQASSLATAATSIENFGPTIRLFTAGLTAFADFVDAKRWTEMSTGGADLGVAARLAPDQAVFWRERETLLLNFREVDADASPTADLTILVRVRRLRSPGPRTPERFQLTS